MRFGQVTVSRRCSICQIRVLSVKGNIYTSINHLLTTVRQEVYNSDMRTPLRSLISYETFHYFNSNMDTFLVFINFDRFFSFFLYVFIFLSFFILLFIWQLYIFVSSLFLSFTLSDNFSFFFIPFSFFSLFLGYIFLLFYTLHERILSFKFFLLDDIFLFLLDCFYFFSSFSTSSFCIFLSTFFFLNIYYPVFTCLDLILLIRPF